MFLLQTSAPAGAPAPGRMPLSAAGGGADAAKEELVQQIKDGQRQNPSFKEAWGLYCETHCQGVRDPNRHSADVLRRFLTERGVIITGKSAPAGADYGSAASGANRAY